MKRSFNSLKTVSNLYIVVMNFKISILLILFGTGLLAQPVIPSMPMTGIDYIKKHNIRSILYSEKLPEKTDSATSVLLEYNKDGLIVKTKEMNGALATQTLSYFKDWTLKDWKRFDKNGKAIDFVEKENKGDTLYTFNSPKRTEKRVSVRCNGIPFLNEEIITENGKILSSKKINYTADCRQSKTIFYWGGNGQKNEVIQELISGYMRPVKKTCFDSSLKVTNVIRYSYNSAGATVNITDSSATGVKEIKEEIAQAPSGNKKGGSLVSRPMKGDYNGPIGNSRRSNLPQTEYKAVTYDEKGLLTSYEYYVDGRLNKAVELSYTFNK